VPELRAGHAHGGLAVILGAFRGAGRLRRPQ
jgi:hypothetical protein